MNEMTQNTGAGYASPFKSRYDNFIGGKFVAQLVANILTTSRR